MFGAPRAMLRRLTLAWGRTGRAPGWYFHAIERWGGLASDGWLTRRLVNGCEVRCDLRQYIDRHIFFVGLYEPVELYLLMQMLEPGQTVIDGGANIGLYSIMMSTAVGEVGSVHSFEPVPGTHAILVANVGHNRLTNVTVSNAALSDEAGVVSLGLASPRCCMISASPLRPTVTTDWRPRFSAPMSVGRPAGWSGITVSFRATTTSTTSARTAKHAKSIEAIRHSRGPLRSARSGIRPPSIRITTPCLSRPLSRWCNGFSPAILGLRARWSHNRGSNRYGSSSL